MLSPTGPWLRRLRAQPDSRTRLICFPHAGGSASTFTPLARACTSPIEVLGVQSPGRQDRRGEPCLDTVAALAAGALPSVLEQADRPIALFGHSLGAVVAFEVARLLAEQGLTPCALFASGRRAPSAVRHEAVHLRSDTGVLAELRTLGGPGIELFDDPEVAREFLPVIRSDYRAVETYRCPAGARVDCAVTVLVGDRDPRVTRAEAEGWRAHTTGPFALHTFRGGHFYLTDHLKAVAETVERQLGAEPTPRPLR
ncbi:thioesterase II family protein [Nocardia amamiensis]|uniref:thioesterase II family protein n=1 Tax=Nocardia amamiensis TaxID=404578 RepID=UPI0008326E46|nr:alpha/beta fold hydrolase [Nocardia amamiensis]